jgi:hypothetical protein
MDKVRMIFMVSVASVVLVLFGVGIFMAARYTLWSRGAEWATCRESFPALSRQ